MSAIFFRGREPDGAGRSPSAAASERVWDTSFTEGIRSKRALRFFHAEERKVAGFV